MKRDRHFFITLIEETYDEEHFINDNFILLFAFIQKKLMQMKSQKTFDVHSLIH